MILCDCRGVKTTNKNNDEKITPLKNTSDDEVEYLVESELLMVRHALSVQVKDDELKQQI